MKRILQISNVIGLDICEPFLSHSLSDILKETSTASVVATRLLSENVKHAKRFETSFGQNGKKSLDTEASKY